MNLNLIKNYCKQLLEEGRCSELQFHNYSHTKEVVSNVKDIATHSNVGEEDLELLIIAAYFHDVGNKEKTAGHEALSIQYAENFLTTMNYSKEKIQIVKNMIDATQIPQNPQTELEKMLCDADLGHLGKNDFMEKNKRLRKEWEVFLNKHFSNREWLKLNIGFLENQHYFTAFAMTNYQPRKEENLRMLMLQLEGQIQVY